MSPLRRTGPPERRTALVNRSPLARSAPLPRTSRLPAGNFPRRSRMRPYRPTVSAAETAARALVAVRSMGRCEGCGRAPATDYAHRVGRAQGGPWCPANALALDRACHEWSHANPIEARSVGWLLRSTDNPLTFPALLHGRGHVLLTADGLYVPSAPPTEGAAR